jgi:hypothetical protein
VSVSSASGYRVYYGTSPRSYQQAAGSGLWAGSGTTFNATGLQRGVTYYFSVTAMGSTGGESTFSNEVSKLVQ